MVTVADTAFSIAVIRAEESSQPEAERLFEDPYAALFQPEGAPAVEATARYVALPFFRDGIRLRTRFLDDAVREGLSAGLRQVVLLGAGFDARGLRMKEIEESEARVFEVDFPAQLERKRAMLERGGVALPPHVAYVPFDFGAQDMDRELGPALAARGFCKGEGAVFVWEGVIGYIDDAAIDTSLAFMAREGGPGSRVAFTFAFTTFDRESVEDRTRRLGFSRCDWCALEAVWRRHMSAKGEPPPTAAMTHVGVAVV